MTRPGRRILVLGLNYLPEPTGIAPYTTGMVAGLRAAGHDVQVLTAYPHYPQWRIWDTYDGWTLDDEIDGGSATRLRHYVPRVPRRLQRAMSELSFGARLVSARWQDPDVVICVSPALISSAMAIVRATTGRKRPAVGLVIQDIYSLGLTENGSSGLASRAFRWIEKSTAQRADGVVVIHERFKTRVQAMTGLADDRVRVIRNWTHVPASADVAFDRAVVRDQFGWDQNETIVLHAGAMGEKQALGNVVEAARIADARKLDLRFVLVGDGGQRGALMAQARTVQRIQFLDPLPDDLYARALRSANVLLLNERPGLVEMAVPSKLTSYFSTGLPVLAATEARSTAAEEVTASRAGVRVSPGQPQLLLEAAQRIGDDPALAARLGAGGPSYCSEVLSQAAAYSAYDAWVRDLAEVRGPARAAVSA